MTSRRILLVMATAITTFAVACGATTGAGAPTPTASADASSTTPASSSTQPSSIPSQVAQASATPSPSTTPADFYLDDRSSAEEVVRSYYDAIARGQYLRAYSYWEPSASLPTFDTFAKGFADTTNVQVELGSVGGSAGAGQLNWSVPAAIFSTTSSAGAQNFVGCYNVHLAQPAIQATPPFMPMAIQTAQVLPVATAADARAQLATACGTAYSSSLPWGAPGTGIDAARYVDDRSAGEDVVLSYYNAVNRGEYTRAYSYWETGASQLPAFDPFQQGYANTKSVALFTNPGTIGAGAGQTYYSVPAVIVATNNDGTTTVFSGCYTLHLGSPDAQATPPFQPLAIQSAQIVQAADATNPSALLSSACS